MNEVYVDGKHITVDRMGLVKRAIYVLREKFGANFEWSKYRLKLEAVPKDDESVEEDNPLHTDKTELNLGRFQKYVDYLPESYSICYPLGDHDVAYFCKHSFVDREDFVDRFADLPKHDICFPALFLDEFALSSELFMSKVESRITNLINAFLERIARDINSPIDMNNLRIGVSKLQYGWTDQEADKESVVVGYVAVSICFIAKTCDIKKEIDIQAGVNNV